MKIGIVTIIDYINYGNRLQNYAVQKVLNNLGHEAVSIKNLPYNDLTYITEGLSKKDIFRNKIAKVPFVPPLLLIKKKLGYFIREKKLQLVRKNSKQVVDRNAMFQLRENGLGYLMRNIFRRVHFACPK